MYYVKNLIDSDNSTLYIYISQHLMHVYKTTSNELYFKVDLKSFLILLFLRLDEKRSLWLQIFARGDAW